MDSDSLLSGDIPLVFTILRVAISFFLGWEGWEVGGKCIRKRKTVWGWEDVVWIAILVFAAFFYFLGPGPPTISGLL